MRLGAASRSFFASYELFSSKSALFSHEDHGSPGPVESSQARGVLRCGELEDFAVLHQRVDFTVGILGKAVDVVRLQEQRAVGGDLLLGVVITQSPDGAEVVVAVNIDAVQRRRLLATINVAADDAQADAVVRIHRHRLEIRAMGVFHDGLDIFCADGAGLKMVRTFADAPAVIAALDDQIHFLSQILADVAAPERAGGGVPTVTPRIAQAVGINLLARAAFAHIGLIHERIIARDAVFQVAGGIAKGVAGARVHVEAQHFGQQRGSALAVAERIIAAPPSPRPRYR